MMTQLDLELLDEITVELCELDISLRNIQAKMYRLRPINLDDPDEDCPF